LTSTEAVTKALLNVKGVAKISTLPSAVIVSKGLLIVNGSPETITWAESPEAAVAPTLIVNLFPSTLRVTDPSKGFDVEKGNSEKARFQIT